MPGGTPKEDALKLLPAATQCKRWSEARLRFCVIHLPDGRKIATGGNAGIAWNNGAGWARRHPNDPAIVARAAELAAAASPPARPRKARP